MVGSRMWKRWVWVVWKDRRKSIWRMVVEWVK